MAYVNKKVYTDHSLMDEVVYNCKIILSSIVLKNDNTADENETEESITESDYYISCKDGNMTLETFPMTLKLLMDYGYSLRDAQTYLEDRSKIPEEDRDDLLNYLVTRYINEYVEKNNYYRALQGLPEYETTEYDVYIDPADPRLAEDDHVTDFNFTIPIHKYSDKELNSLRSLGILSDLVDEHFGDHHYRYIYFLNVGKIDPYNARKTANWDILFIPNCENLVKNRFIELYTINKSIYSKRTYQQAYAYMSDYFDEMIMIMMLSQTFADIIAELPEWYIRRDIFDLRSAKYFLESQGVKFFKDIPLKYQIKLVKNLNRLIKYKSTNKNIHDILEIFGIVGTTVYKYYIYKDYLPADAESYDDIDENGNKFKLAFVMVPLDESYDKYIQDKMYQKDYDLVTSIDYDKYWDGDLSHELVKEQHCKKDFSIEGTKYMFLDYNIDLIKYRFQLQYFMGMIFSTRVNTDDINIMIPSISNSNYYSITDLCILLCCLEGPYIGRPIRIHFPFPEEEGEWYMLDKYDFGDEEIDTIYYDPTTGGERYDFGANYVVDPSLPYNRYDFGDEEFIQTDINPSPSPSIIDTQSSDDIFIDTGDWMKNEYSYLFENKTKMVYGFNLSANLEQLEQDISMNHSAFGFEHGYTLSDFGCDTFKTADTISTIDELNDIYMTNKECFDNLMDFFENKCDTRDKAVVAQYIFDTLFITQFDFDFYMLSSTNNYAEYYDEILKERSFSLYKFYMELTKEPDLEVQKDGVRNILNEIVSTLEYFIGNQANLEYIFSFVPTNSPQAIINYLSLVINFFKSWKVHFVDPATTYVIRDKNEEQIKFNETISEMKYKYWKDNQFSLRDAIMSNVQIPCEEPLYTFTREVMNIYGYFDIDPDFDNVYNGAYPDSPSSDYELDANGGNINTDGIDCVPFVMVNGGTPFGIRLFDTISLDGSTPRQEREYSDIDGFDISDPNWKQILGNDIKPIGYDIFGGFPGKLWSDSIDTKISKTLVITNDVRVSNIYYDNKIYIDGDKGLYFGNRVGDEYAPREMCDRLERQLRINENSLIPEALNYLYTLKLFSSEGYLNHEVENTFKQILYSILMITQEIDPGEDMIEYLHKKISEFNTWFDETNPFKWEIVD